MRKIDPVKHEEKRRQILQAAGQCFLSDGFRGASISDICARADISPGHLYHYFDNKEAIVAAMAEMGIEYATSRIRQIMEADPDITLSGLMERLAEDKLRRSPGPDRMPYQLFLEILAEAARNPPMAELIRRHTRSIQKVLADFLRQSQLRGHTDPSLHPEEAALVVISIMDGVRLMPLRDPTADVPRMLGVLKTLIDRFLSPKRS
ncbi:MAG: TetR/AcrR family transcriptional regulator [Candidatus Methylacidiphilales bacterium]|nr:TetR/AcrR family transcriptional regulator [Candidatus Methylacidiphilales bacterium]